jgi:hypothetical protein
MENDIFLNPASPSLNVLDAFFTFNIIIPPS